MTTMFDESSLPEPLIATIAQFAQWVDTKIVEQSRGDVVDSQVFHYTSGAGVEGILSSGFIRLTHLSDLADDEEFLYGRKLVHDALSSSLASAVAEIAVNPTIELHAQKFFCDGTLSMLPEIGPAAGPFQFYSASFCRRGDDAFFWREYANKGAGFALTLSPALFADPPAGAPLGVMDKVFRISMLYDGSQAAAEMKTAVEEAVRVVKATQLPADGHVAATFLHAMSVRLLLYVITIAVAYKKPCFAPEQEIRLLLLNEAPQLTPLSAITPTGRRYIRYDFTPPLRSPSALTEITIGPRAPADAETWLSQLLLRNGYPVGPDGKPVTVIRRSPLK
jgi:hypothetical protein